MELVGEMENRQTALFDVKFDIGMSLLCRSDHCHLFGEARRHRFLAGSLSLARYERYSKVRDFVRSLALCES